MSPTARSRRVHDISLTVQPGTIVTVIGPNGAGKTTLLAAIMGLLPARGDVQLPRRAGRRAFGRAARCARPDPRARAARAVRGDERRRQPRARRIPADRARAIGAGGTRCREVYHRFPRLEERRDQLAGTLSGGERQMLAMGRALMGKPTLLMLDEPSLGLAPLIVREIFRIIADAAVERRRRSCWSSRTRARRCRSPITATCWRPASSPSRARAPSLAANPRVAATYLGKGVAAAAN